MVWWNDHSIAENDRGCTTEHCHGRAVWRLEVDGVEALYCDECKDQLDDVDLPPLPPLSPLSEAETITRNVDPAEKKTTGE